MYAKYEPADVQQIVKDTCNHLTKPDKEKLLQLLTKYENLFDGTLGEWNMKRVNLEFIKGETPYHDKPYLIPVAHKNLFGNEVNILEKLGVLKREDESEWASPTFIIAKKEGTVTFLSDFRQVNKRVKRNPWPLPKIQTVLNEMEGF